MSQDSIDKNNIDKIKEIDEEAKSLELNIQKALSLLEMGVAKEAAFEDAFKNLDALEKIVNDVFELGDVIVIDIAKDKFLEAMTSFEEKIKVLL
ncbi:hypothetical protein [Bacillus atrophaeus]|uniref:hypothetical protein n=1 Tax=Bacillus atrophaeus TaxID=1452 RepID=UPI002280E792|nr:hypothetical protein [Bacillus atrophaeus]MCY7947979.1 hypothetical protein [Bacillus atrophaeus]MCY8098075.1 hypothetical protein [Bacillus atrophaeus]MCY9169999.1 hypothetical protein [Bacillus atrophaeus]MEC0740725.1 hypothetical protein [Bacillus atrophaeus]MEC0747012.1 hypothetical protein [Bacillus atrophaeus]